VTRRISAKEEHMSVRQRLVSRIVTAAIMLVPGALAAQQTTILVGSVRDSSGRAVADVEVRLNGGESPGSAWFMVARTNDSGGFRLTAVPVGHTSVVIRRLGFGSTTTELTLRAGRTDSLVVSLTSVAESLPGVLVEDEAESRNHRLLAGFWERRSHGFGSFLTRPEIEKRAASNFVDLVRTVPSTSVTLINGRNSIRFRRNPGIRDCPPQYWVDGMRLEQATPDEFSPEDVEGIEIYPGPATLPLQFAPRPNSYTCGAIIIWTRLPGS
jgi:hypothetical protein